MLPTLFLKTGSQAVYMKKDSETKAFFGHGETYAEGDGHYTHELHLRRYIKDGNGLGHEDVYWCLNKEKYFLTESFFQESKAHLLTLENRRGVIILDGQAFVKAK